MNLPIISLITFLPLAGAVILIFIPGERKEWSRLIALLVSVVTFGLSLVLLVNFDASQAEPQLVEKAAWLGYGINYHVGVDGLSLLLILLTTFLFPIAILSGWRYIDQRVKEYHLFLLFLETGIIGVFVALNLFLFYVFWEVMLIPMYFLIGLWGGPRRIYATIKFVLFTMLGSLLMLVAIFVLYSFYYRATGIYSFEFADLTKMILLPKVQTWLFLAFALAFAIKVPMFPFHTWLPDAHVEAPTAGSVILAAVLLKMGVYGFLRLAMPLFPQALAKFTPWLMVLSLIGIIYGGLMALIQKDVKSLVAYSSVSHMGLIMLALFSLNPEAIEGSIIQMVNHGLSTGALFLIVGILYERAHTRLIKDYGGVSRQMPVLSAFFLVCMLSSLGLPGLNGFVGEILCLFGVFQVNKVMAYFAVSTVILAAGYLLWMYQRVMHGPIVHDYVRSFRDLNKREIIYLAPVVLMMFWIGLYPNFFLRKMDTSVNLFLKKIQERQKYFVFHAPPHPLVSVVSESADLSDGLILNNQSEENANNKGIKKP